MNDLIINTIKSIRRLRFYRLSLKIPPNLLSVFSIVFIWRVLLEIINYFLVPLINRSSGSQSIIGGLTDWMRWDGGWYYNVYPKEIGFRSLAL